MHVDTGHNFPEVLEFRDRRVAELGLQLIVAQRAGGHRRAAWSASRPTARATGIQTPVLLDAVEKHRFDALFGGARRDEEKARAKERVFCFRDEFGQWDPKNQRPELWTLYNARIHHGRVDPGLPAVELDRARRVALHRPRAASSCRRSTSPTSARSSTATACSTR